jgi:hypothetical protein
MLKHTVCLYVNHLGRASQNATAITIMSIDIANALKKLGHEVFFVVNKPIIEEDIDFKVYSLSQRKHVFKRRTALRNKTIKYIKS